MNEFKVNFDVCRNKGLKIEEFLFLLSKYLKLEMNSATAEDCYSKHWLTFKTMEQASGGAINAEISEQGAALVEDIITTSEAADGGYTEQRINNLAFRMKELYPKGKKPGSNFYWSDGTALISRRLKLFFKKYGTSYAEEDILDATERYVKDYQNNMKFMKLLKYFILKEAAGAGGDVEPTSDLLNYMENKGQENETSSGWMEEVR